MTITIQQVAEWIIEHAYQPPLCPMCGSETMTIMNKLWELREFSGGGLRVGSGPLLIVVGMMCGYCFHVMFFNANKINSEIGK